MATKIKIERYKPNQKQQLLKQTKEDEKNNELFKDDNRFNMHPIKYSDIYNLYIQHENCFWRANDIDLSSDKKRWNNDPKCTDVHKKIIKSILGFFASADKLVDENIDSFISAMPKPEIRAFYTMQSHIENIHIDVYGRLIQAFVSNEKERIMLLTQYPKQSKTVKSKISFCKKWMNKDLPLTARLVAFAAIEGIFFVSSFCFFHWVCSNNILSGGFKTSNEFISRDEQLHVQFAIFLFNRFELKLDPTILWEIIDDAVNIECEFVEEVIDVKLNQMNISMMNMHIKSVANKYIDAFGLDKKYKYCDSDKKIISKSPFNFMVKYAQDVKFNFFETKVVYTDSAQQMNKSINEIMIGDFDEI